VTHARGGQWAAKWDLGGPCHSTSGSAISTTAKMTLITSSKEKFVVGRLCRGRRGRGSDLWLSYYAECHYNSG